MKLEVGMYVRTNKGIIEKLTNKTMLNGKYGHYFTRNDRDECYAEEEIVKSSFNLIDLIEVGDFINGYYVDGKNDCEVLTTQLIDTSWCDEDCDGEMVYHDEIELLMINIEDIQTILTHEQYEANAYKVGE